MSSLFDELEPPEVACIDCKKFAAGARDPTGWLLRRGNGYCNDERHPGGIHNVIQSITAHRKCPHFEAAPAEVAEQRRRFVSRGKGD